MHLISNDVKIDFEDVLIVPKRSKAASRKAVDIERTFKFYHSNRTWTGTPIIAANMDTTGTINMAATLQKHKMITCLHKHYGWDDMVRSMKMALKPQFGWFTIGIKEDDFCKLDACVEFLERVPNICIDVANGYTDDFVAHCRKIRDHYAASGEYPIIMAGNVCTPEMVQELILHGGVDIVKIGIGPGSGCTTRHKTGVGYPQLSAIIECSHAAHGLKSDEKRLGLICADGGCRQEGDVCKAFVGNADFVMLGGMLAGTDECEGEWEYEQKPNDTKMDTIYSNSDRKKRFKFYGMSSKCAQDKHHGQMADYKASEGRVKYVDYKGEATDVIQEVLGGIRSCCSYIGSTSIKDMSKCGEFIRVSRVHFDKSL